jgi:SAM-dependent methyltransferase
MHPRARRIVKPLTVRGYGLVRPALVRLNLDRRAKYLYESLYWRRRKADERVLGNDWYEAVFTTLVGLDREAYAGKRVLDIGCGPRGSLEWATHAARRVGLDPLVPVYRRLGIDQHAMEYVAAPAEAQPFPDASFDIITSINSLDHVDDLEATIEEIDRILAPGGLLLIVVEVGHAPTIAEPHRLGWDLAARFGDTFVVEREEHLAFLPDEPGVSASLRRKVPFDHDDPRERSATLHLQLRRMAGSTLGPVAASAETPAAPGSAR